MIIAFHVLVKRRPPGWGDAKKAKEFVSFVDLESERLLSAALRRILPGSSFFGEEAERSLGDLTWVVDPLDGTTNYISGLDWFSISVALFEGLGEGGSADRPLLGMVHRPANGESYWAIREGGAYYEGPASAGGTAPVRLPRAKPLGLADALVGTGTPYRSPDTAKAFYAAA